MKQAQQVYYSGGGGRRHVGNLYYNNGEIYNKEWLIEDPAFDGGQAWLNSAQLDAKYGADKQYLDLADHIYGTKWKGTDASGINSTYEEQLAAGRAGDDPANRGLIPGLEVDYPEGYADDYFKRSGVDPNNMTDLESARFSSTLRTKAGFAPYLDEQGYGDAVRTAVQGFEARGGTLPDSLLPYGIEANTDTMVIPNRTGATSSATAQSEAARVDTNRQTRKNKGSSSYGGGRTSVRTSNSLNT